MNRENLMIRNINDAYGDPITFGTLAEMEQAIRDSGYEIPSDGLEEGRDYEVVGTMAEALMARYPGAPDLAEYLDTEGFEKSQDWKNEATIWFMPDGSRILISGPTVEQIGWTRPEYCAQPNVPSCRECSLVNYGRDCQNNQVEQ